MDKILFTIGLITKGLPGEWMKGWMTEYIIRGASYGTWSKFQQALTTRFENPNLVCMKYNNLQKIQWKFGEALQSFCTRLEICAGHAGYLNNDQELIHLLKRKIPQWYIRQFYHAGATPPVVYAQYRDQLLNIYTSDQSFKVLNTPTSTDKASLPSPTPTTSKRTSSKSKKKPTPSSSTQPKCYWFLRPTKVAGQQQAPVEARPDGNCHVCGKTGHWKKRLPGDEEKDTTATYSL
jgi:hypothetical protein